MKMKRTAALSLALLLLAMWILPCSAAQTPVLAGQTLTVVPGQTISYQVSISGNPGLASLMLNLSYDTNVLSAVTVEGSDRELQIEAGEPLKSGSLLGTRNASGCRIFWYSNGQTAQDGVLFTLQFSVRADAPLAAYPIRLSYVPDSTFNAAEQPVVLQCESGSIITRAFEPLLYGQTVSARQGTQFDYCVYLQDAEQLASCGFMLRFDPTRIAFDDSAQSVCTLGEAYSAAGAGMSVKAYQNGARVFVYSAKELPSEGVMLIFRLRVLPYAELGPAELTLQLLPDQTVDVNGTQVPMANRSGSVTVELSAQADVTISSASTAHVRVSSASGAYAVAVFYDAGNRMAAVCFAPIQDHAAVLDVSASDADLRGCTWKVLLLNAAYAPICEPFCSE